MEVLHTLFNMGQRIYNRELDCGCLISSDKGGGVIPCCREDGLCEETWKKYKNTEDYRKLIKEIEEKNG